MIDITPIKLLSGHHMDTSETGQGCFMDVAAYLNGDKVITDRSPCVCITIRSIVIRMNDEATDNQRQKLLPFVLRAVGSATNDCAVLRQRLKAVVEFAKQCARIAADAPLYTDAVQAYAYATEHAYDYACTYIHASDVVACAANVTKSASGAYVAVAAQNNNIHRPFLLDELFQCGLDFLDTVLPPLETPPKAPVKERLEELINKNREGAGA